MKRWSKAKKIRLPLSDAMMDCSGMLEVETLAGLTHLDLSLGWSEFSSEGQQQVDRITKVASVLGNKKYLSFLRMKVPGLIQMPHLAGNLNHLQLMMDAADLKLSACVNRLSSLKTLALHTKHDDPDRSPALNLISFKDLKTVKLDNVIPENLSLPVGCDLHVRVCSLKNAKKSVWLQNVANLRSFVVITRWIENIKGNDEVPSICFAPCALECLHLEVGHFGTPNSPIHLCGALVQSKQLSLDCEGIYVEVPQAGMACSKVWLRSEKMLSIFVPRGVKFLDACVSVQLMFETIKGVNLAELCKRLRKRNIILEDDAGHPCNDQHTVKHRSDKYELSLDDCFCGWCWTCVSPVRPL